VAEDAFSHWRNDSWNETRQHAKPVRDFLIRRTLDVARKHDRPFHFHCGGGDPDINLAYASPRSIFPLLVDVQDQPVVLIHSGYPWVREAAYVASVLLSAKTLPPCLSITDWTMKRPRPLSL